jgi:hypothetical protein
MTLLKTRRTAVSSAVGKSMLLVAASFKLIAEIALMALLGQGFLALLAGDKRQDNFFYKTLQILTGPFTKLARAITPRVVIDRHIPFAAFALMLAVWVFATLAKVNQCMQIQLASTLCR